MRIGGGIIGRPDPPRDDTRETVTIPAGTIGRPDPPLDDEHEEAKP